MCLRALFRATLVGGSCAASIVACGAPQNATTTPAPVVSSSRPSAGVPLPAGVAPKHPYPVWPREDVKDTLHGVVVPDPYRGLEDGKSERVKAWMTAEDGLARRVLSGLPGRDAFAKRLTELTYLESSGMPWHRGTRYFTWKSTRTSEKSALYVRDGRDGKDRAVLDPNLASADGTISFRDARPSKDGSKIAYARSVNNADDATLYVRDVASGKDSTIDVIPGARYADASWVDDGFYYVGLPTGVDVPEVDLPGLAELRFHKLGTDPKSDLVVREKTGDSAREIEAFATRDGHWLVLSVRHGWASNDLYVQDLRTRAPRAWVTVVEGVPANFEPTIHKDRLYVRTDDGAKTYRVMTADLAKPARANWKELLPARADAVLRSAYVLGGKLVTAYLK
ncbi:S9 family peptidase, partial [bacterium]